MLPLDLLPLLPHDVARRLACSSPITWDHAGTWRALSRALPEQELKEHERRWPGLALPEKIGHRICDVHLLQMGYLIERMDKSTTLVRTDEDFRPLAELNPGPLYMQVVVSPSMTRLAVQTNMRLDFYDATTFARVGQLVMNNHMACAQFVDDTCFAVTVENAALSLFDVATGLYIRQISVPGCRFMFHLSPTVLWLDFSPPYEARTCYEDMWREVWTLSRDGATECGKVPDAYSNCALAAGDVVYYCTLGGKVIVAWSVSQWRELYRVPNLTYGAPLTVAVPDLFMADNNKCARVFRGPAAIMTVKGQMRTGVFDKRGTGVFVIVSDTLWRIPL